MEKASATTALLRERCVVWLVFKKGGVDATDGRNTTVDREQTIMILNVICAAGSLVACAPVGLLVGVPRSAGPSLGVL